MTEEKNLNEDGIASLEEIQKEIAEDTKVETSEEVKEETPEAVEEKKEESTEEKKEEDFTLPDDIPLYTGGQTEKAPTPEIPTSSLLRPKMGKRVLSAFIDFITAFLVGVGVYAIFLSTAWGADYTAKYEEIIQIQEDAKIASGYGEYKYIKDDEKSNYASYNLKEDTDDADGNPETTYYYVADVENPTDEIKTAYSGMLSGNARYTSLVSQYQVESYTYIAIFVASGMLIFYIIVPLTNKKRATLGMLAAKLETYNYKKMERAAIWQPLVRGLFTMVITYLAVVVFGITSALFVPLFGLLIVFMSKNYRNLHDFVAVTMSVDSEAAANLKEEKSL